MTRLHNLLYTAFCAATILSVSTVSSAQNAAVTVSVDAQRNRHPINANIYGVAQGSATALSDLNVLLNRYGGNNASRYNWQMNADNRGNDWYFESVPESSSTPGERGDTFVTASKAAGAQAMLTIPMIDYVGKVSATRTKLASFSIAKYGAQTGNDWQWYPDAGNGILKLSGNYVTGNNPLDANVPNSSSFQATWVNHLIGLWGNASNGGPRYYILDNEPSIWFSTHRDVHPTGPTMDEMKGKMVDYARMIKSADPGALIVGPEEWGWSAYFYSGYDQQYGGAHGWGSLPDRINHGGWDYMPWMLDQLRQYDAASGIKTLDVFSLHYYPQGGEFSNDTSTTMQLRRNRSTRSLWDPNYVDPTWINSVVKLIPRMKSWVATYYPALQTAITEYNWGAEGHINGATTQADIWGIFGREGLDMSARWTTPSASTPTYKAMKLYRNYDGNKSGFGDTSAYSNAPNPDDLSAFAATRSTDGAMTVMLINKVLTGSTPVTVNLSNFTSNGASQVWQLTSANTINRLADVSATASVSVSVPAQSITLLVLPVATTSAPTAPTNLTASAGDSKVTLNWTASGGAPYYTVKRSTVSGGPYSQLATNLAGTTYTDMTAVNGTTYYYVVSATNIVGTSADSNQASATPSANAGPSATYIKTDKSTQGTWKGAYGADGYSISQLAGGTSLPAYAQYSVSGNSNFTWASSTTDVRALQKISTSDRIAASWYGSTFTASLNLTDENVHRVALYMLDWDMTTRSATIDVLDAATNAVLDSQLVSAYNGGKWLVWSIKGNVKFRFTKKAGPNVVLSGVFFN